jgi:hypothetical protein
MMRSTAHAGIGRNVTVVDTIADQALSGPTPTLLLPATATINCSPDGKPLHVYVVLLAAIVRFTGVWLLPLTCCSTITYCVTRHPLELAALHDTLTAPSLPDTDVIDGDAGTPHVDTGADQLHDGPTPTLLFADNDTSNALFDASPHQLYVVDDAVSDRFVTLRFDGTTLKSSSINTY